MKRIYHCLLPALVLALLLFSAAAAENGFTYEVLPDGTARITGYRGDDRQLTVPAELGGHPVSGIGEYAVECPKLTRITLPDTLINVNALSLSLCYSLEEIRVSPDNPALAAIDGVLFGKADKKLIRFPAESAVTEYAIPEGIEIIGDYAFGSCEKLKSITIPSTVTYIGEDAFFADYGLTQMVIPGNVRAIGARAFWCCEFLKTVDILDGVESIGDEAFAWSFGLEKVSIPASVTRIGEGAFDYTSSDTVVIVPRGSYAAGYFKDYDSEEWYGQYTYPDANDWLTGN